MTFGVKSEVKSEVKNMTSNSVNPGVIIGPDGKQLLLQKGEIRNPHDGEAFVGKYGEILDVGNGYLICIKHFQTPRRPPSLDCFDRPLSLKDVLEDKPLQSCSFNSLGHSGSALQAEHLQFSGRPLSFLKPDLRPV